MSKVRTGRTGMRPADEWYPTVFAATLALDEAEAFRGPIHEPACGNGAIAEIFTFHGHRVIASDLYDHGYGEAGRDFLAETRLLAPNVITNPPYSLTDDFVRHAVRLGVRKMALFLPVDYQAGTRRSDIIEGMGLARVHVLRNRVTLAPYGMVTRGGTINFAWFIWLQGYRGPWQGHRLTAERGVPVDSTYVRLHGRRGGYA